MEKIELMDAQSNFVGPVAVGEYVAQWLSADKTESVPLSTYSHDNAEDCIAKARESVEFLDLIGGQIEVMLIVPNLD